MRDVVALLVHNGINNLVVQAQRNDHNGNSSSVCSRKHGKTLRHLGSSKVPCSRGSLAHSFATSRLHLTLGLGLCNGASNWQGYSSVHLQNMCESLWVINTPFKAFISILILGTLFFVLGTLAPISVWLLLSSSLLLSCSSISFPSSSSGLMYSASLGSPDYR